MIPKDKQRFATALAALGEIFGETLSTPRMNAYFAAMSDLTIEQVEEAARRLMNSSKFFPKPVEFREALLGSASDQAEQAWRTFVKLCVDEGHYPSLQIADGAMAFAIEHLGGWQEAQAKLNDASVEMFRSYENQFKTSYRLGLNRAEAKPKYFIGEYEAQNKSQAGRMVRAKGNEIGLAVCVVNAGGYTRLSLPFDLDQGQLTGEAQSALLSGNLQKYLPRPAREQKALSPAATDDPVTPEDIARFKAEVKRFTLQAMPQASEDDAA
jgi:hypothetical protein